MIVVGLVLLGLLVCFCLRVRDRRKIPACVSSRHSFQHSNFPITAQSFRKVKEVRRLLIKGVVSALEHHDIRYVVSDGNLLEMTRGKKIVQDDDIDIRIHTDDLNRWMEYCQTSNVDRERNLDLKDDRRLSHERQKENGFQVFLLNYDDDLEEVRRVNAHVDVVAANVVVEDVWINYEDAFAQPLRRVNYMGTEVSVPSEEMTHALLVRTYGEDYMTPSPDLEFDFDPEDTRDSRSGSAESTPA